MLFPLGKVVATPGAMETLKDAKMELSTLIDRHSSGDWGGMDAEDKAENNLAVKAGRRLMSSYDVGGQVMWIITEADRSATTALLPDEY